ncbi:S8 family serine peptidase [Vallicoccus soli]|uniref:Peptidase S8/S53 domain-containing protein n=1 Tax=Vallicoccus soli TaxID=2339232 RepID=A0A3A3Z461_9ACTN|nr:S8 family serine peptidase [Vallicoccus soli]RJK96406.1 hypothetical protein D5H78_09260 [Vallicoccus soli]
MTKNLPRPPRAVLAAAAVLAGLLAPAGAAAAAGPAARPAPPPVPGPAVAAPRQAPEDQARITVRLEAGAPVARSAAAADGLAALDAAGAQDARPVAGERAYQVVLPADEATGAATALEDQPGVASVSVGYRRSAHLVPKDPLWRYQEPYMTALKAPTAWDTARSGPGVKIAVVDTGVAVGHPDLAGKVVARRNVVHGDADVRDAEGHGTAVASVAAAAPHNRVGMAGAGWGASIIAVKVADDAGGMWSDDVARGIRWAADQGADVINLSLGGPTVEPYEREAVAYARSKGAVVVASAGNEGTKVPNYPAALPGVISVGASNHYGTGRPSWSSFGAWVDVAAPGSSIAAANTDGTWGPWDGTSFSSPLVAGEVALLVGAAPDATEPQLTAAVLGATRGGGLGFARGIVDFPAALASLTQTRATSPRAGAVVSGAVAVTASSASPYVRFALPGQSAVVARVAGGVARASVTSYGLSGAQPLRVSGCTSPTSCSPKQTVTTVTVRNPAPAVTVPAEEVRTTAAAVSATAPGGAVRFLLDGRVVSTDASAPYQASLPVYNVADGPHTVQAVLCSSAATVCDTAHPSPARTIQVRRLHPAITSLAPAVFTPDGDGRDDASRLIFTLERAQAVRIDVRDAAGTSVREAVWASLPAGKHVWYWDGRRTDGTPARAGKHVLTVSTSATVGGVALEGLARAGVTLQR